MPVLEFDSVVSSGDTIPVRIQGIITELIGDNKAEVSAGGHDYTDVPLYFHCDVDADPGMDGSAVNKAERGFVVNDAVILSGLRSAPGEKLTQEKVIGMWGDKLICCPCEDVESDITGMETILAGDQADFYAVFRNSWGNFQYTERCEYLWSTENDSPEGSLIFPLLVDGKRKGNKATYQTSASYSGCFTVTIKAKLNEQVCATGTFKVRQPVSGGTRIYSIACAGPIYSDYGLYYSDGGGPMLGFPAYPGLARNDFYDCDGVDTAEGFSSSALCSNASPIGPIIITTPGCCPPDSED